MRGLLVIGFYIITVTCLGMAQANASLKTIEQGIGDSVITTTITAKFTKSRILNPLKIHVSTEKGTVKLSGDVRSKEAFVEALRLAVNTRGVKQVDTDELAIAKVNSGFTDAYITARVETAVLKAKVFDDESIPLVGVNAHTKNGEVTLSGKLPNERALSAILKRINKIGGVTKIISNIVIDEAKA
ncbi:BON domain-containing protein [Legionella sp. W05-934-2]|jgi:hyperosmotically inducible protein|uniref:BON domain-containing protein n=1 Tax=Legionella sp. W05-934-2 TaxID=1198649 RepID=UPI0034623E27